MAMVSHLHHLCHGGESRGRERQAHPSASDVEEAVDEQPQRPGRGRPRGAGAGNRGVSCAHAASVRSHG